MQNSHLLFSYIDPSTGSLLITSVISLGLTVAFSLRGLFYRLVSQLSGKKIGLMPDFADRLVFYSEGGQYWRVFEPVVRALQQQNCDFVYLTSDPQYPGLASANNPDRPAALAPENTVGATTTGEYHYIGKLQQAVPFLNKLRAKVVVMTTPQLGIFLLKRSKHVQHYAHLVHAPTDPHTYRLYAFDQFDSVLCSSENQMAALRELEELRSTPRKLLLKTGCTYYDAYHDVTHDKAQDSLQQTERPAILYAPTWGHISSLNYAKDLMQELLQSGFRVIFRPHPQSWESDAELLQELQQYFGQDSQHRDNWELDRGHSAKQSFQRCFAMVCDLSGIAYDFAFLYRKPIFAIDVGWAEGGYEAHFLTQPVSCHAVLARTGGKLLNPAEIQQLPEKLKLLQGARQDGQVDETFISEFVFNFRQAGTVAARQLQEIMRQPVAHNGAQPAIMAGTISSQQA